MRGRGVRGDGLRGTELVRLLSAHPEARVASPPAPAAAISPTKPGSSARPTPTSSPCPTGSPPPTPPACARSTPAAVVIDLSGDLRLPTAELYKSGTATTIRRPRPARPRGPYGLTEVYRDRLRGARLISNPGCYATSVLLPLVPLLRDALSTRPTSWSTRRAGPPAPAATPARGPAVLRGGRRFLGLLARAHPPARRRDRSRPARCRRARRVPLTFCPHLLPVKRGILSALYVKTERAAGRSGRGAAPLLRRARRSCASSTARRRGCPTWCGRTTAASPCTRRPRAGWSSSRPSTTS